MNERLMVVVGYDGAEALDIDCVMTPLALTRRALPNAGIPVDPPYRILLVTPGGLPITADSGIQLLPHAGLERVVGPVDTLFVVGGPVPTAAADDPLLVAHVRRIARDSRRVASVCTGAAVLAAAGLLDGRRATTHWAFASMLAERYPAVTFDPYPIYIKDGNIATSAGMTSGLDLTLALVEDDHGPDLARWLAQATVVYLQRPGNQGQMSMFTKRPHPEHPGLKRVIEHVHSHLEKPLTPDDLADVAGTSVRNLNRLFKDQIAGRPTPMGYIRKVRTQSAAHMLASTTESAETIAQRCGFHDADALRRAFVAEYGTSPTQFRTTQAAAVGAGGPT